MTDWGVPDWNVANEYDFPASWTRNRWRWEFLRRRNDLRDEFDLKKDETYRGALEFRAFLIDTTDTDFAPLPSPDDPGFTVPTFSICGRLQGLPNPRISEQPWQVISWSDRADKWHCGGGDQAQDGFLRFDFDLSKPIEPQLAVAKSALHEFQEANHGKRLQSRTRPDKWRSYLRVLDARADGASWAEISSILEHSAASPQSARDAHEQARALCFNSWN